MKENVLTINNLSVTVCGEPERYIIRDVHLSVPALSITAIVGGSGSGKTTTGLAILNLLPPALCIKSGDIFLGAENLLQKQDMRPVRGKDIGMVFQEPLAAFNPVMTVGAQIMEVLQAHTNLSAYQREERTQDLLNVVGIKDPKVTAKRYPHQLSGGMRQRAMIAQAIALNPKVLIADEPTSNLDVSLQAKIMELFRHLKDKLNMSIVLISHDLGMVSALSDYVAIMNRGAIVEYGRPNEIVQNPREEYTRKLIEAFQI